MKFVGKTSVAIIKSAILGAFTNELFFFNGKERKRRRGKENATCAPLGPVDSLNRSEDNLSSID